MNFCCPFKSHILSSRKAAQNFTCTKPAILLFGAKEDGLSMQYQSVYDLIRRALPGKESCFLLREMKVEEAATGQNCYCVGGEGEKIILSGDCAISLCMAFYAYLREECGVNLSWCGNREIAVPEELPIPAVERRYEVPQKHRVYMNYCTFGYSALVWDWARWEKEIDFILWR